MAARLRGDPPSNPDQGGVHLSAPQVLLRYRQGIGKLRWGEPSLGPGGSSHGSPYLSLDRHTGVGGKGCTSLGIEVQRCLPQGDTSFLQQVFVRHAATRLSPQDDVDQPVVPAHQGIQAVLAPRLSAVEDGWTIRVEWVYNAHTAPPLWIEILRTISNP
jgi:hypothetical protein